ncbi:Serine--tRNA ligase [Salmonella enterica subsp. enterica serovar Typhimurium str. DT104]|nr:Serine--tRNA ligase [Salmonella enterica subsp. enterica serovar Typhimurium str. DT104]
MNIRLILNNKSFVEKKLATRGFDISIINELYIKGQKRNILRQKIDALLAKKNLISKEIGAFSRQEKDSSFLKSQVSKIKTEIETLEAE